MAGAPPEMLTVSGLLLLVLTGIGVAQGKKTKKNKKQHTQTHEQRNGEKERTKNCVEKFCKLHQSVQ